MKSIAMTLVVAGFLMTVTTVQLAAQEHNTKHHHYKLIDIGTLGGPNTFVTPPLPPEVQINQRGMVAGRQFYMDRLTQRPPSQCT